MAVVEPIISLCKSNRGGDVVIRDGRSYTVVKGKLVYPIEEFVEADQLALIEEQPALGIRRYTPWYLKCRSSECKSSGVIKRLEDGSFFDFSLKKGSFLFY